MSDPDSAPDPVDNAYAQAESMLSDEPARAARRERVLAAIDRRGAPAALSPAARPRLWRRGGFLVAAGVSGLVLILAGQLFRPLLFPPPSRPSPRSAAATTRLAASAPPVAAQLSEARSRGGSAGSTSAHASAGGESATLGHARPGTFGATKSAPPVLSANSQKPAPRDIDEPATGVVQDLTVTAEKRESAQARVPVAVSAFASRQRDVVTARSAQEGVDGGAEVGEFTPSARGPADGGARLRAAAAGGRVAEVRALLEQGVPVDSPDADGDTALMKSIQADQPAAAALLRRHGAGLDHKNQTGESARDMVKAAGDAALSQAVGVGP